MDISARNTRLEDVQVLHGVPAQVADDIPLRLPRAPSQGLAMSLERRRLQFYMILVLADIGILLGSFALANAAYPLVLVNHDSMLPAYLLLPLFQTIAFYNSTYSRDGLTKWRSAAWHAILALIISALMFNFFAFFAKANAEFSRVAFTGGLVTAGIGMVAIRWIFARFILAQWGPSAINRLLIEAGGPPVADSLSRFGDAGADRPEMWEDGIYAAEQYWPVGSGAGTFDEVFQLHESLEFISPRRAGRAHSDFIELGMEAGLFGLALAALWLAWTAAATWTNLRRGPNWPGVGAGLAVGAIALQSLLDYPLRNQTLLCVAGVLVVLLVIRRERSAAAP